MTEGYGSTYVCPNGPNFDFAILRLNVRDVQPVPMDRHQLARLAAILRTGRMKAGENVKLGGVVVKRTDSGFGLWFPHIQRIEMDFDNAQKVAADIRDCLEANHQ